MDIKEFSAKLAEATKELSTEEQQALMKMFASVSDDITKTDSVDLTFVSGNHTEIPNGVTPRLEALKENYLKQKPTITTHKARVMTEIARKSWNA